MSEKDILKQYEERKKAIYSSTPLPKNETPSEKIKRVNELLNNFEKFCEFYFPEFFNPKTDGAKFGWFHKKAAEEIINAKKIRCVLEWPREHAKSVFADIMLPLFLKAKGNMTGMVIASATGAKAQGLLSDIQAQLESNQRYIYDFGEQYNYGSWSEKHFVTKDGMGFWAVGRRESPRGLREGEKRPDLCIIDDIDDDEEVENPAMIKKSLKWLRGALFGAIPIKRRKIIMVGNRIGKNSLLANIVGDKNEGDKPDPKVVHIKVFALENPKTHAEDQSPKGVPAWKERYTVQDIRDAMDDSGYAMAQREYFHRIITEGEEFKEEWLHYDSLPPLKKFEDIVTYNDPSFKGSISSDFKSIIAVGFCERRWWIIDIWCIQAAPNIMAEAHYDMHERLEELGAENVEHWIEANFIQDMLIDYYTEVGIDRKYNMYIREDKEGKPNKKGRISGMVGYFMKGLIIINKKLQNSPHFQNFKDQLLGFPHALYDDGPDSLEGGLSKIKKKKKRNSAPPQMGGKRRDSRI